MADLKDLGKIQSEIFELEEKMNKVAEKNTAINQKQIDDIKALEKKYKIEKFVEVRTKIEKDAQDEINKSQNQFVADQSELRRMYFRETLLMAELTGLKVPKFIINQMKQIEEAEKAQAEVEKKQAELNAQTPQK